MAVKTNNTLFKKTTHLQNILFAAHFEMCLGEPADSVNTGRSDGAMNERNEDVRDREPVLIITLCFRLGC